MKRQPSITAAEYQKRAAAEAKTRKGHASDRYNTAGRGRREDLKNIYFRSKAEANYARYLEWLKERGEIRDWEYEPRTFWFESIRRGVRSYTPDFQVWPRWCGQPECDPGPPGRHSYFVELKAWLDPKSKTKLARMAKYFPDVRLELVDRKAYSELANKVGPMIRGWER